MAILVLSIVLVVFITLILHTLNLEEGLELDVDYFLGFIDCSLILLLFGEGGVLVHVH